MPTSHIPHVSHRSRLTDLLQAVRDWPVRLLPADPQYAPFGWAPLRGLARFPLLLAAFVGTLWATRNVMEAFSGGVASASAALRALPVEVVMAVLAFLPMLMAVVAALNLTERAPRAPRALALAAAVLAGGALCGWVWGPAECLVGFTDAASGEQECALFGPEWWRWSLLVRSVLVGSLFALVLWLDRQHALARRRVHEAALAQAAMQRQQDEARLRMLQAQIEPHFLFNTLAHVEHLLQADLPAGGAMLDSLSAYLASALPQMRAGDSTLAREMALVRAYLHVQQVRMPGRLNVTLLVPEALAPCDVPPMLVLTLVENAIKHGVGPRRAGGSVSVLASREDDRLCVQVLDDGLGLAPGAGAGRGLANTRARLRSLYGSAGQLRIGNRPEGGVCAELRLPLRHAAGGGHADAP